MTWTCVGEERGACGVPHPTTAEASAHLQQDHAENGWTDRYVVDEATGEKYGVTKDGNLAPVEAS